MINVNFIINLSTKLFRYTFGSEDLKIATKLTTGLLAYGDLEIQCAMYQECYSAVVSILGVEFARDKRGWENLGFLFEPTVMTEIICHGLTHENAKVFKSEIFLNFTF